MPTIPQRELRNEISSVLRRAEQGERFVVTVGGRPAAELGPLTAGSTPAHPARLEAILGETSVDPGWEAELDRLRDEDDASGRDPWSD